MGWTKGSSAMAMSRFIPVCVNAILNVSPFGIPSLTNIPANHIVPVVPMFAPNTAAIADGKGKAPLATRAIIAVVDTDQLCQRRVITMPPMNIQIGLPRKTSRCSSLPIAFIPPLNIFKPM